MHEIVPVILGLPAGVLVAALPMTTTSRFISLGGLSVILGTVATVITGEALISWSFLLIDIPLSGSAALGAMVMARAGIHLAAGPVAAAEHRPDRGAW